MTPFDYLRLLARALVAVLVEELAARTLPRPPLPPPEPTPEQRAALYGSTLAGRLWDRYRDPAGDATLSTHGRHMAILYAAVLDHDTVGWLARQICAEYADAEDAPPLSYEVTR